MNRTAIDMLSAHQARVARISVGPSTARNQGGGGVVDAARRYLAQLDLRRFSTANAALFRDELDQATEELQKAIPRPSASWGVARKVLNIFIRDSSYHVALNERFHLARANRLMEVPLDSLTAAGIKAEVRRGRLPAWPGVKHLSEELSDRFQAVATEIAQSKAVARVDLDVLWWGLRDLA